MPEDQARVPSPPAGGAFGPNAWLVDDMFEEYRTDPSSVSESWREFFADYVPGGVATVVVPTGAGADGRTDGRRPGDRRTARRRAPAAPVAGGNGSTPRPR